MMTWVSVYLIRGVAASVFFAVLKLTVVCCIVLVHFIGNDVCLRLNIRGKRVACILDGNLVSSLQSRVVTSYEMKQWEMISDT